MVTLEAVEATDEIIEGTFGPWIFESEDEFIDRIAPDSDWRFMIGDLAL